jgi:hypothetical protein
MRSRDNFLFVFKPAAAAAERRREGPWRPAYGVYERRLHHWLDADRERRDTCLEQRSAACKRSIAGIRVTSNYLGCPKHQLRRSPAEGFVKRSRCTRCICYLRMHRRVEYPSILDPAFVPENLGRKFHVRHRLAKDSELEMANVEQQLMVSDQPFHRPGDGLEVVRVLEALNDFLLNEFGQIVTPLASAGCWALAAIRTNKNSLRVQRD